MRGFFFSPVAQGVTLLLMLSAVAAVWLFLIREESRILADQDLRIEDESLTLDLMRKDLASLENVYSRYQGNIREMAYFRREFLRQKEERSLEISNFLHQAAETHQVNLNDVNYRILNSRYKEIDTYEIVLPVRGRYRDIRNFIASIETSELFLVIAQMSVQDSSTFSGSVDVDLTLATFFEGRGR